MKLYNYMFFKLPYVMSYECSKLAGLVCKLQMGIDYIINTTENDVAK